jgi:hypothetical protein
LRCIAADAWAACSAAIQVRTRAAPCDQRREQDAAGDASAMRCLAAQAGGDQQRCVADRGGEHDHVTITIIIMISIRSVDRWRRLFGKLSKGSFAVQLTPDLG